MILPHLLISAFRVSLLAPKTCHHYFLRGARESGYYDIDPDGEGDGAPFNVNCDFTAGKSMRQLL